MTSEALHRELDREFQLLVQRLDEEYTTFSKPERIRIEHWIRKLCEPVKTISWKRNRNNHVKLLLSMVRSKRLEEPFDKLPYAGELRMVEAWRVSVFEKRTQKSGKSNEKYSQRSPSDQPEDSSPRNRSFERRSKSTEKGGRDSTYSPRGSPPEASFGEEHSFLRMRVQKLSQDCHRERELRLQLEADLEDASDAMERLQLENQELKARITELEADANVVSLSLNSTASSASVLPPTFEQIPSTTRYQPAEKVELSSYLPTRVSEVSRSASQLTPSVSSSRVAVNRFARKMELEKPLISSHVTPEISYVPSVSSNHTSKDAALDMDSAGILYPYDEEDSGSDLELSVEKKMDTTLPTSDSDSTNTKTVSVEKLSQDRPVHDGLQPSHDHFTRDESVHHHDTRTMDPASSSNHVVVDPIDEDKDEHEDSLSVASSGSDWNLSDHDDHLNMLEDGLNTTNSKNRQAESENEDGDKHSASIQDMSTDAFLAYLETFEERTREIIQTNSSIEENE